MEIIRGLHNIRPEHRGTVLTIGNFDGVHHGHKMLLAHLAAKGLELSVKSMLITFEPQPREFFAGASVPARLTRFREKMTLLMGTDLDQVLLLPFNQATANLSADTVVENLLVEGLDVRYLVVGDDFRFGQGAGGDYTMLKDAGDRHGFGVSHMGTLSYEHDRVSSSRVREVLAAGDFPQAEQLMGHPYFIMGNVVYGRQLGRQLGVPTANIRLQRYKAALEGVYAVSVTGVNKSTNQSTNLSTDISKNISKDNDAAANSNSSEPEFYTGIANIGVRPTVDGKEPLLEVHIFDYTGNLYGQLLTVTFHHKLRDEQTFAGLEELKAQIDQDITTAKQWFVDQPEAERLPFFGPNSKPVATGALTEIGGVDE